MTLPADIRHRLAEVDAKRKKNALPPRPSDLPELSSIGRDNRLDGAACAGHPLPLWDEYLHDESPEDREHRHDRAREICSRCPVRANCRTVAAELPAEHRSGIYGAIMHRRGITPEGEPSWKPSS